MVVAPDRVVVNDHTAQLLSVSEFCRIAVKRGAIFFCSGRSLSARFVRLTTWSRWSHCGMLDIDAVTQTPFLWESVQNPDGCIDVLTETNRKSGVRLVPLHDRLERYAHTDGDMTPDNRGYTLEVGVRHMWVHHQKMQDGIQRLEGFQTMEHQKAYEQSLFTLARSQYEDVLGPQPQDTSEYHCSELVAETIQNMGLLSKPIISQQYTPKMLAQDIDGRLPFQSGMAGLQHVLHIYRIYVPAWQPHEHKFV